MRRNPAEGSWETFISWEAEEIETVHLVLKEVYIFREPVDAIYRGWSAGIRLEGNGMEPISNALKSAAKSEYVRLSNFDVKDGKRCI